MFQHSSWRIQSTMASRTEEAKTGSFKFSAFARENTRRLLENSSLFMQLLKGIHDNAFPRVQTPVWSDHYDKGVALKNGIWWSTDSCPHKSMEDFTRHIQSYNRNIGTRVACPGKEGLKCFRKKFQFLYEKARKTCQRGTRIGYSLNQRLKRIPFLNSEMEDHLGKQSTFWAPE